MSKQIMITTVDNPYDPYDQFAEWLVYDMVKGYRTCERLGSIVIESDQMTDSEIFDVTERGCERLCKTGAIDKNGNVVEYKKLIREKEPLLKTKEQKKE